MFLLYLGSKYWNGKDSQECSCPYPGTLSSLSSKLIGEYLWTGSDLWEGHNLFMFEAICDVIEVMVAFGADTPGAYRYISTLSIK